MIGGLREAAGWAPLSPDPVTEYGSRTIPPYLGNGLIGLRCGRVPFRTGVCIASGLAGIDPAELVEGFARAPYPLAGDVALNGEKLSDRPQAASLIEQRYDFSCGELHTALTFRAGGVDARIDVIAFCSRTLPMLALQEIMVTTQADCSLTVSAAVDPEGVPGRWLERETGVPATDERVVDGSMLWETFGGLTQCGAAYWTEFDGGSRAKRTVAAHNRLDPIQTDYAVEARTGRPYRLRVVASVLASQFSHQPQRQATRLVSIGRLRGFDRLRTENREAWRELWRGRPILIGADRDWQRIADASFYYLHASAHEASLFSTSMFGLAYWPNYHYYRGQVMWDIETFAFPPLLLTAPDSAAALLDYRFRHLESAHRNAAMNGYEGVQFPWASGPLHGEEAIRTSAPLVAVEQHVSLSVAHAFAQYVHATGYEDYLGEVAWPVLEGVARWLGSRLTRTRRGFEFRDTLGFAEGRRSPVNNPAYVNMAAAVVLREAASFANRLGRPDGPRWQELADRIFIPIRDRVILNHDRFTPDEAPPAGTTPEALGGLYPFGYTVEPAVEEATIRFYLDRVEPYIGSPMFSAPLCVFAARLGDRALAERLLREGYAEFINRPWLDANEFSVTRHPKRPVVGPFCANLGGFLGACLYGLTGLELGPDEPASWARRPVVMPEGWTGIEVERIWARGRPARLRACHGDERAQVEITAEARRSS